VLAALLVLAVLLVVTKFYVLSPNARAATDVKAPSTPEAIERGRYLAHHVAVCMGCHSQVEETKPGEPIAEGRTGSGRDFGEIPGFPGRIRAPNLTPDRETGIGSFSDGELLRAMREGIARDGHVLFPMMPYRTYAKSLTDADALAIIAYLRSLQPIKNQVAPMSVDFPVSMFIRALPEPVTSSPPAPPPTSDVLARGNWLLTLANCHDCHDSFNERREPVPGKELAGGAEFPIAGKGSLFAPNITSDKATGIGSYSDDDLMRVLNDGVGKSGRKLYGMPWPYYGGMVEEDKRALIAALRQVKPVSNVVQPHTFKP
jgi:mono/diheme cytochrome c family protein